jgi:hypothetical protein
MTIQRPLVGVVSHPLDITLHQRDVSRGNTGPGVRPAPQRPIYYRLQSNTVSSWEMHHKAHAPAA